MTPVFDLIAFDADDTLWHNETLFMAARDKLVRLLANYATEEEIDLKLGQAEIDNLEYYGFGVTGFTFSMIEAALAISAGSISGKDVEQIIEIGKWMLNSPLELFDRVPETLASLAITYPLMLITKGELLNQQRKLDRSGLGACFRYVEIVNSKTTRDYAAILAKYQIQPASFMMVGNSLKSDILPVLELGGCGVYIPFKFTWVHEQVAPQKGQKRYLELEHIGQLPALIEKLNTNQAA